MARLVIRRQIAAAPRAVWDVIADLEHQAAWMVDVRKLAIVTTQKQGVGTVLRVTSELFGLPIVKDVMAITSWEPPSRMDVEHRGQFHGTGSFVLDAVDGGTLFTWTEEFEAPLGRLGEFVFSLVVRPHLMRVFARSMANVARMAEVRGLPTEGHR